MRDAAAGHGFEVGRVEIAQVGLAGIELAGDAVEAGGQIGRDAEVGVERARDRAILDVARPRGRGASGSGCCRRRR